MSGTETTASTVVVKVKCATCHGTNVEICMPAWFDPNNDMAFYDMDADADELSTWCRDCGDSCVLIAPDGSMIRGRW